MRFAKRVTVQAPRQVVWDLLWDIARLASCVPGCQSAEMIDPYARYRATVQEKVGPFRLTVPLDIDIVEHNAPQRLIACSNARLRCTRTSRP
jgi:carbon monoxide dehydrogenase subunit G